VEDAAARNEEPGSVAQLRRPIAKVVRRVVREHGVERGVVEREWVVRVRHLEFAVGSIPRPRSHDGPRVVVDPRDGGARLLREQRRDAAGAARDIEDRRQARAEPRRERARLSGLEPSRLPEVLVVSLEPDTSRNGLWDRDAHFAVARMWIRRASDR
jgi:hypothetical protein